MLKTLNEVMHVCEAEGEYEPRQELYIEWPTPSNPRGNLQWVQSGYADIELAADVHWQHVFTCDLFITSVGVV